MYLIMKPISSQCPASIRRGAPAGTVDGGDDIAEHIGAQFVDHPVESPANHPLGRLLEPRGAGRFDQLFEKFEVLFGH